MGKHRDWTEIREDYKTSGLSYAALSRKYNVPIDTLKKAAIRQGWEKQPEKRARTVKRAAEKMAEEENGTDEMAPLENGTIETAPREAREARFYRTVDLLLEKAEAAAEIADPDQVDKIRKLASALKDLQSLLRLGKDELDKDEQKARIAKLKAETADAGGAAAEPIVIRFVDTEEAEL